MSKNPFINSMSGEDIKNWIWKTAHSKSRYASMAKKMNKFFNLDDNKVYMLKMCDGAPIAIEVKEKGKKYEVHCPD